MSEYSYRPWQEGDDLELLQIWPDAESTSGATFRASLGVDSDDAPWKRTLVVEHQGIPIGAGTIYETSLHTQHLWSYVEIAPDHRRQGVGTELLRRLRELAQHSPSGVTSLRSKVDLGSVAADFARETGFTKLQRSKVVRVEAGSVPSLALHETEDGRIKQSIEDIATGSVELTQRLWEFYQRSHQWDPPADIPLGRINRLFLSDEAEAFGAIVLRDEVLDAMRQGKKGAIKAFAVSYRPLEQDIPGFELDEDAATEVLLGYDFDYPQAREAILQLLSPLVAQYPVTIEVDESMEDLSVMVNQLIKMGSATVVEDTLVVAD
ncbi:MAG: GNAT family N-acetyltransferase [Rothia sp. (in: high G+C Gram-positive bacteria)]|nr:GNAT family N-acetyltransferase [Rothia sp. (in: high G+C Gram-positive bacteria)]